MSISAVPLGVTWFNTRKLVFNLRHFFCQDFQHKYINQVIKEGFQVILLLRSDFTQLEKKSEMFRTIKR